MSKRPPFIIRADEVEEQPARYPDSDELLSFGRPIGRAAGLKRIGLHIDRLPPGHRTSWPHAEEDEEEFVYVLEGHVDVWVDGDLFKLDPGDLVAFPAGTGIAHCFINNYPREATLLVGGEASKPDSRILYPLHPVRRSQLPREAWWDDAPVRAMGTAPAEPRAPGNKPAKQ